MSAPEEAPSGVAPNGVAPRAPAWSALPAASDGEPGHRELRVFQGQMEAPDARLTEAGRVVLHSVRCADKESPNEDAAAVVETAAGLVIVVADGMGGQAAGETASRMAVNAVCDAVLKAAADEERLRGAILDGIEAANREILALATGAGTTLAVAHVAPPFMRPYHVGDSAIVLMGQRGRVKFETIAHSPVGYAEAAGVIGPREAIHHEDRHLVSNFVGSDQMRIEIGPALPMARFDTLLVASDGLVDNLLPGEAVTRLRSGCLLRAAGGIARLTRGRMEGGGVTAPSKPDDMTFVLFRRRG